MRGVLFFVYLCFLLLRGYDHVYADIYQEHTTHVKQAPSETSDQEYVAEDTEDNDRLLTGKGKPLSNSCFTNAQLIPFHDCFRRKEFFYSSGYVYPKYILQRTLRI